MPSATNDHLIRHIGRILRRVDRHQDGDGALAPHLVDEEDHVAAQGGVEAAEGLVEQDQRTAGDEGAGQGHALALTSRHLAGLAGAESFKANSLQRLLDEHLLIVGQAQGGPQAEADVLRDVQVRKQVVILEDDCDRPLGRCERQQVLRRRRSAVPLSGVSKPAIMCSRVVLPPPDGPMTAQRCPVFTDSE